MAFVSLAGIALDLTLAVGLAASPAERGTHELRLRNGMHVSVVTVPGARTFALHARFDAGPVHDPAGRAGLSAMAAEWLAWPVMGEDVRGPVIRWTHDVEPASPASLRWLELQASGWLGREDVLLSVLAGRLSALSHAAQHGVRPEYWERFRAAAVRRAQAAAGSVDLQLWAEARAALYPHGSSLARASRAPSLDASSGPEALQAFLRAHVTPARTHVVLAGDFRQGALRARLERTLGRVMSAAVAPGELPTTAASGPERWTEVRHQRPDLQRDHLLVVCPGDRSRPRDRLATRALAFLLAGAGDSSRLGRQLVDTGLVYTVDAGLAEDGLPGLFYVRTASSPSLTAEVLARVRGALEDLVRGDVVAEEVEAFLASERADQRSVDPSRCVERLLLGRPRCADPPASLSLDDVIDCARRLFARGAPTAFVLGPGGSSALGG